MKSQEILTKLILDVGTQLGIDGLEPDEDGLCVFAIDEVPVALQIEDGQMRLVGFVAEIAEGEENPELSFSAAQWRAVMEINKTLATSQPFSAVAYDQQTECVILIQPVLESDMEAGQIVVLLEGFIERLEKTRLLAGQIQEADANRDASPISSGETLPSGMFV